MNIHPIFVHFPIALLSLYSIFEIIRFKKVLGQPYWFQTKAILVIVGVISAFPTLSTGEIAEHASGAPRNIIELHSAFAVASVWIYGIIAALYLLTWLSHIEMLGEYEVARKIFAVTKYLFRPWVLVSLSLIGFISLGITGTLGGSLVYGPHGDIFIEIIYSILGL